MSADELAGAHYRRQQLLVRRTGRTVQAAWQNLDPTDLSGSYRAGVGATVLRTVAAAQLVSASAAPDYVTGVIQATGENPDPDGQLNPTAFAGVASDGRQLEALLYLPIITTKQSIALGISTSEAMRNGLAQLLQLARTQVVDAGRTAVGAGVVNDRKAAGWVRYLQPPSCGRCAVLAGRFYKWSDGFQRHPRCDCQHRPVTASERRDRGSDLLTSPRGYFDSLSAAEQDRLFGLAQARAIRDGADISQVVNASRSTQRAADVFGRPTDITREGITRRGLAGQRLGDANRGIRLMPEQIYRDAKDRDDAIRLLRRFSYIL